MGHVKPGQDPIQKPVAGPCCKNGMPHGYYRRHVPNTFLMFIRLTLISSFDQLTRLGQEGHYEYRYQFHEPCKVVQYLEYIDR